MRLILEGFGKGDSLGHVPIRRSPEVIYYTALPCWYADAFDLHWDVQRSLAGVSATQEKEQRATEGG